MVVYRLSRRLVVLGNLSADQPRSDPGFKDQAEPAKVDTNFNRIVAEAQAMEKANPEPQRQFGDLMTAIGTNDIRPYFPYIDARTDEHPTYAVLNALQKKAAGKIKLGLDLQGGTQFLVSLDTNHMVNVDTNGNQDRHEVRRAAAPGFASGRSAAASGG